jgi:hypothetical protein
MRRDKLLADRRNGKESSTRRRARRDARQAAAEASVLARATRTDERERILAFIGLQKEVGMKLGEAIHWSSEGRSAPPHTKRDLQAMAILKGALALGILTREPSK